MSLRSRLHLVRAHEQIFARKVLNVGRQYDDTVVFICIVILLIDVLRIDISWFL